MLIRSLCLLLCLGCCGLPSAGMRVIENTTKKFTFEWTTDNFQISQKSGPVSVSFSGANVDLGDDGEPIVPAFSLDVGVPQGGAVTVRVTPASSHTEVLRNPLRVRKAPGIGPRYPGLRFTDFWISNARYSQCGPLRFAQLILRPVAYRAQGSSVQVLDKAIVSVEFPPAASGVAARPGSDYQRMLSRLLLNYPVAAGWAAALPVAKRASVKSFPLQITQPMLSFMVGDGHSNFNEGTIDENGIMMLRASDITRLLGTTPPMSQVALYVSYKGELPVMTPPLDQIPDGVSEVPLARFDVNKNNLFDSTDYLLAYVSSISDWFFDTSSLSRRYSYKIDHYDDYRHYWIVVKNSPGLSLDKFAPVNAPATDTITSFQSHLLLKQSKWPSLIDGGMGGLDWTWAILSYYMPSFTIDNLTLPHADPAEACSLFITAGHVAGGPSLTAQYGGSSVCTNCQNQGWLPFAYNPGKGLTFSLAGAPHDTVELNQIEFKYMEKLDMTNQSAITVFSPESPGIVHYRLSGLPTDSLVYIMRISNGDASMSLVDTVRGRSVYEWTDTAGLGIRYFACTPRALESPKGLAPPPPASSLSGTGPNLIVRDLRNLTSGIDYLVVSHPNFMVEAQKLARDKWNLGRFGNPKAISASDIYFQFSGGNTDPSALRNCIEYLHNQTAVQFGKALDYVVLMGGGHYDYRNLATQDTSFIPVAEFDGKCIEDFFAYLDPGDTPDSDGVPELLSGPDSMQDRARCDAGR